VHHTLHWLHWLLAACRTDRTRLRCLLEHRLRNRCHAACAIALHDSVYPKVSVQVSLITCRVLAVGALEWFLARVFPKVCIQAGLVTCRVLTLGALEFFLARVLPKVYFQVALSTCRVLAVDALEWLLARVFPKVILQVVVSRCLIVAFGALVHDHCDDLRAAPDNRSLPRVRPSSCRRRGQARSRESTR
jgi:hypothetical protein